MPRCRDGGTVRYFVDRRTEGLESRARISRMRARSACAHEADEFAGVWLRSRAASVPETPPPVHAEDEVRVWFREVVLFECEVWVADDDGVIALMVLKDDRIDQLYVDARSAFASRQ